MLVSSLAQATPRSRTGSCVRQQRQRPAGLHRLRAAPHGSGDSPAAATAVPASGVGSLISETLKSMESDAELKEGLRRLKELGQKELTRQESEHRRRALSGASAGVTSFNDLLKKNSLQPLRHGPVETLQVNLGLYCNQACNHCHVESSPLRLEENMSAATADRVLHLLRNSPGVRTLDLTGGAPELNPQFRRLVAAARAVGVAVIDRCNLTVFYEDGQADLERFFADNQVRVVASLPCYTPSTVDAQRGFGVFERSIGALRRLNAVGYGVPGSGLSLDLVYNPSGAFLPPAAAKLEAAYKQELGEQHGVQFSSLLTLANMPIKRFADRLHQQKETEKYMSLLVENFNAGTVPRVMCTSLVSVRWDGACFSCDFNQQLDIDIRPSKRTIFDFDSVAELEGCPVATDLHCLGCTAGAGSSCGGSLV